MVLTNIKEIDLVILLYIDNDYQLYQLSKVSKYLEKLYENHKLWSLKIARSFEGLSIISSETKKIYFNINQYNIKIGMHYDEIRINLSKLITYSRKNNIFSILDWLFDYFRSWFDKDDIIGRYTIEEACENNNIDLLEYAIEKFGTSEEEIIKKGSLYCDHIGYIKLRDKCLDVNHTFYSGGAKCLYNATINNNIKILNYIEKHGIIYNVSAQNKTILYPCCKSIDIACQRGHFETVTWCKKRYLC